MEEFILFIITFIFVFVLYQLFLIGPRKKKKAKKELLEIRYLETRYALDVKKISYPQLLQICAIVSSLDISMIVWIIVHIHTLWLMLLVGFIAIFLFILISYHFVYLFYKKKGMVKDGKHK